MITGLYLYMIMTLQFLKTRKLQIFLFGLEMHQGCATEAQRKDLD